MRMPRNNGDAGVACSSYRYTGRLYASMDPHAVDDTVVLRSDLRDPTGGLLLSVLGTAAPESGHMSDLLLEAGRDVGRLEIVSEELRRGRQMGYTRAGIVDADRPERVLVLIEGQGVSIGTPREGL